MYYADRMTYREIAEALGMANESVAKKSADRGLRAIQTSGNENLIAEVRARIEENREFVRRKRDNPPQKVSPTGRPVYDTGGQPVYDDAVSLTAAAEQELVPHIVALASIEAVASLNPDQLVKILNPTCDFLLRAGSNLPALSLSTQAVPVSTAHLGPDHPSTLIAESYLARSYRAAGRTDEAIAMDERVAADMERLLGRDHPHTLIAQSYLASSYRAAGRTDEAIAMDERVAADTERLLGPDHLGTLTARGNLASSYHSAGRADEASPSKSGSRPHGAAAWPRPP
jgi:tetratricopeptide (TPR) repeat protein